MPHGQILQSVKPQTERWHGVTDAVLHDWLLPDVNGSPSAAQIRYTRAPGPQVGASPCNTHRLDSRA
jgi:hypothetical protein